MTSNFDCIGLGRGLTEDGGLQALVDAVLPGAVGIGGSARGEVLRWQDPSGARVLIEVDPDRRVSNLTPSFDAAPGAYFVEVVPVTWDTVDADVVDRHGALLTRLVSDLEQRALIADGTAVHGPAAVVGLGVDVTAFSSTEDYEASDASLLDPDDEDGDPHRLAAESFISYGVFAGDQQGEPYARLSGTVLGVSPRRTALTGERFAAVRVRTAGMEVDVCLPEGPVPPAIGGIVSGTVFLVSSMPGLETPG